MADLKTITLPDNSTYSFRDSRVDDLAEIKTIGTGLNLSSAGVLSATGGGSGGAAYSTELPMGSDATDYPAKQLADTALTEITYDYTGADAVNALADLANENRGLLENSIHYRAKQVVTSSITIAARSASSNLTITPDTISGFTPIFVSPRNTGHQSLHFRYCYLSTNNSYNDTINVTLGNPSASSVTVSNAWVNILYVRDEFVRS